MDLSDLKGIGPTRLESLRAMGIVSLRDLAYTLPIRYEDHSRRQPCGDHSQGPCLMEGIVRSVSLNRFSRGMSRTLVRLQDESGWVNVCWFNQPWIARQITVGQRLRVYGHLTLYNGTAMLQNPRSTHETGLVPVYSARHGIPGSLFRDMMKQTLNRIDEICPETLPERVRSDLQITGLSNALREIHFPSTLSTLDRARRRIACEEFLNYLVYVSEARQERRQGAPFFGTAEALKRYWEAIPFRPTGAQSRVLQEIADDLGKERAMSRLLQGDVGCGKSLVAFGAIALAHAAGYQAAMMAPTEILARQHFQDAEKLLLPLGIRCALLTGETKAAERKRILRLLAAGEIDVLFGTHALTSADVTYHSLRLVITDEQHRFGVHQRTALEKKAENRDAVYPHVLVMSATPIPRSLALILYGDLDLSIIDELPKGRKPVKTRLVPEEKRDRMYCFVREEISRGRQAYIVCPLVEDKEETEAEGEQTLKSARTLYEKLREGPLKGFSIGITWGGQKNEEKEATLEAFRTGQIQVLIATTVIEVGVNQPNATIMIIENAERFGLCQLHQLRGRVGRGSEESWCFLMSETGGTDAGERLRTICTTNDGFLIAQKDLEQRGPGDLIGVRQSGAFMFEGSAAGAAGGDMRLLGEVSDYVRVVSRDDGYRTEWNRLQKNAKQYFSAEEKEFALN